MTSALWGVACNHCFQDGSTEFKRSATVGQKKMTLYCTEKCLQGSPVENPPFSDSRKVLFDWRQLSVTLAEWHASTWYFLWDEQALKLIINLKWFCGMLRLNVDGWCHCRAYTKLCQPGNNCVNSSRVFRWKVCPFHEFLLWTIRRHCIKFPTCLAQLKLKYLFWFRKV